MSNIFTRAGLVGSTAEELARKREAGDRLKTSYLAALRTAELNRKLLQGEYDRKYSGQFPEQRQQAEKAVKAANQAAAQAQAQAQASGPPALGYAGNQLSYERPPALGYAGNQLSYERPTFPQQSGPAAQTIPMPTLGATPAPTPLGDPPPLPRPRAPARPRTYDPGVPALGYAGSQLTSVPQLPVRDDSIYDKAYARRELPAYLPPALGYAGSQLSGESITPALGYAGSQAPALPDSPVSWRDAFDGFGLRRRASITPALGYAGSQLTPDQESRMRRYVDDEFQVERRRRQAGDKAASKVDTFKDIGKRALDFLIPAAEASKILDSQVFASRLRQSSELQQAAEILDIPPEWIIAQAALESGWGSSAPGNNLFGIKAFDNWKGKRTTQATREVVDGEAIETTADFRAYDSLGEGILDYAKLIRGSKRYKGAIGADTPEEYFGKLQKGGYATDPDYAAKVTAIASQIGASAGLQPEGGTAADSGFLSGLTNALNLDYFTTTGGYQKALRARQEAEAEEAAKEGTPPSPAGLFTGQVRHGLPSVWENTATGEGWWEPSTILDRFSYLVDGRSREAVDEYEETLKARQAAELQPPPETSPARSMEAGLLGVDQIPVKTAEKIEATPAKQFAALGTQVNLQDPLAVREARNYDRLLGVLIQAGINSINVNNPNVPQGLQELMLKRASLQQGMVMSGFRNAIAVKDPVTTAAFLRDITGRDIRPVLGDDGYNLVEGDRVLNSKPFGTQGELLQYMQAIGDANFAASISRRTQEQAALVREYQLKIMLERVKGLSKENIEKLKQMVKTKELRTATDPNSGAIIFFRRYGGDKTAVEGSMVADPNNPGSFIWTDNVGSSANAALAAALGGNSG